MQTMQSRSGTGAVHAQPQSRRLAPSQQCNSQQIIQHKGCVLGQTAPRPGIANSSTPIIWHRLKHLWTRDRDQTKSGLGTYGTQWRLQQPRPWALNGACSSRVPGHSMALTAAASPLQSPGVSTNYKTKQGTTSACAMRHTGVPQGPTRAEVLKHTKAADRGELTASSKAFSSPPNYDTSEQRRLASTAPPAHVRRTRDSTVRADTQERATSSTLPILEARLWRHQGDAWPSSSAGGCRTR